MSIPHFHYCQSYANKELLWFGTDTEEHYRYNLHAHKSILESSNLIDVPITYKFNSEGFRCDEFSSNPSIVFLGCSFTMGVGIPVSHTFPKIVSSKLNLHCANLGVGGSSNDTAFRLAYFWLEKIKPKIVVLLTPEVTRVELLDKNKETHFQPNRKIHDPFYLKWILVEENGLLNREKNSMAIQYMSDQIGAKFIRLPAKDMPNLDSYARDLCHPGTAANAVMANMILEKC